MKLLYFKWLNITHNTSKLIDQDKHFLFTTLEYKGHLYGNITLYRYPNGNIITFLIEFNIIITNLVKNTKIIIINEDLNIDILDSL